jgi:hypothetical protein
MSSAGPSSLREGWVGVANTVFPSPDWQHRRVRCGLVVSSHTVSLGLQQSTEEKKIKPISDHNSTYCSYRMNHEEVLLWKVFKEHKYKIWLKTWILKLTRVIHKQSSPYRAVNTLRHSYKNQPVNAVKQSLFFSPDPHKTHKYTVSRYKKIPRLIVFFVPRSGHIYQHSSRCSLTSVHHCSNTYRYILCLSFRASWVNFKISDSSTTTAGHTLFVYHRCC